MGKILLYEASGKPVINECFLITENTAVECLNILDSTQTTKPLSVSCEIFTSYRMCPKNISFTD